MTADGLAVSFLGLIATIASVSGASLVFFPELGALAYDVFRRPRGAWARAPVYLALTPAVTAVLGVICARSLPYGMVSMLLAVVACVAMVLWLRSPIAPAISAGVLALVMEIRSWWYPPSILVGTGLLAVAAHYGRNRSAEPPGADGSQRLGVTAAPRMDPPPIEVWVPVFLGFIAMGVALVGWTGLRLILFPPLVVLAYEMFTRPLECPWARRPWLLPVACVLTAMVGVSFVLGFGPGVLATVVSLAMSIGIVRILGLHVPPALAVSLIPQVLEVVDWRYPLAVGLGTLLLAATFVVSRRFLVPANA